MSITQKRCGIGWCNIYSDCRDAKEFERTDSELIAELFENKRNCSTAANYINLNVFLDGEMSIHLESILDKAMESAVEESGEFYVEKSRGRCYRENSKDYYMITYHATFYPYYLIRILFLSNPNLFKKHKI